MRAKFEAVLALRQAHGFAFGKSDLFFCIALTCAGPPYLAGKASTGISVCVAHTDDCQGKFQVHAAHECWLSVLHCPDALRASRPCRQGKRLTAPAGIIRYSGQGGASSSVLH